MNLLRLAGKPLQIVREPLTEGLIRRVFYGENEDKGNRLHIGPNMVHAMVIHPDGTIGWESLTENLITDAGVDALFEAHNNVAFRADYMAVSNNATAPATTDTTLAGELSTNGFDRTEATYAHSAGTSTGTMVASWTATGTVADIHKMGLFTAVSSGTLVYTTAFSTDASVTADDTLEVTDTITIS